MKLRFELEWSVCPPGNNHLPPFCEGCLLDRLSKSQGADLHVQMHRQAEWKSHNI